MLISNNCSAQTSTIRQINDMEKTCQHCIDVGTNNFIDCENIFYKQMDSILDAVYKSIKREMNTSNYEKLKKEQKEWLKRRDNYFKKQEIEIGKSDVGLEADRALAIHKEALFVKDRIMFLLKKL